MHTSSLHLPDPREGSYIIRSEYVQGHPQYRKKKTIHGLPSARGNLSFTLFGATAPIAGGFETGFGGGGGICHDAKALGALQDTFAKGFAKPDPASFELFSDLGNEGRDTFPRPAFWRASLVPSLVPREENILGIGVVFFLYEQQKRRKKGGRVFQCRIWGWIGCTDVSLRRLALMLKRGRNDVGP
jgi:hypothetical protein